MELHINGQQLHVNNGDASLNWTTIRFADAVQDEWSTEIDLPNDQWNITLLDAYGLLDRGVIFNKFVPCSVLTDDVARDGHLQVLSFSDTTVTVRVYVNAIPYGILDKKVCDYYPHEDVVFRWDRYSPISTTIAGTDIGIFPYTYTENDFYSDILAQWHASVSVQKILSDIQDAEDITLPAVYNTLYHIAARKKVCPSNPYQVMMGNYLHSNAVYDENLGLSGGQHITNDFKSSWSYADVHWDYTWTDWMVESTNEKWMSQSKTMSEITFNRDCVAHIKVYACASHVGGILIPQKNGQSLAPAAGSAVPVLADPNWTESDILLFDDYVSFSDGDVLTLHYSGSAQTPRRNVRYSVVIEYGDYEWGEDDYDVDLEYIPAPFGIWGIRDVGSDWVYDFKSDFTGAGDGTNSAEDYSFTYFGAYTNLEREATVRDYLNSLCWVHNQRLNLNRNELIFSSADIRREIDANITLIEPYNSILGQLNRIGYRDDASPTEFRLDNDFLDDEAELHTSVFRTADGTVFPQYSYEMTYSDNSQDGNGWVTDINVIFEDLGSVLATAVQDGGGYTMARAPEIVGFGLPLLTNSQTVTAETLDTVTDTDYVYIDGHKYMVVGGETDMDTYVTEFTAIQCDSGVDCIPPAFSIIEIFRTRDSFTVVYSFTDFTGGAEGTVSIYRVTPPTVEVSSVDDIDLTTATAKLTFQDGSVGEHVGDYDLKPGVNSLTETKLYPGGTYSLRFTITSECGDTEYTEQIELPLNNPPTIKITDIINITDGGGTAKASFSENQ